MTVYVTALRLPTSVRIVSRIMYHGTTIEWTFTDPYTSPESYVVVYGIDGALMRTPPVNALPTQQTYTAQFHVLRTETTYFYRVEISNSSASILTDVMSFETGRFIY